MGWWVETEALHLAREVIKDKLREKGIKISMVKAVEITKAAKDLVYANPHYYTLAETLAVLRSLPDDKVREIRAIVLKAADRHGVKAND